MYTLYNGNCFDVLKNIKSNTIDCILCDPPYNKTACEWDKYAIPLKDMWQEFERIVVPTANIIFTSSQPFTSMLVMSKPEWFRYEIIWVKKQATAPLVAHIRPMPKHENILVFYNQKGTYNPIMGVGKPYSGFASENSKIGEVYGDANSIHKENYGTRYPTSVIEFGRERGGKWDGKHPTQKPIKLCDYLCRMFTNENDLVLDPFMGVGSFGIAAIKNNRNFIGIEIDKKYYSIAKDRFADAEGIGVYNNPVCVD